MAHELYMEVPVGTTPDLEGTLLFRYRGMLIVRMPLALGGTYAVELRSYDNLENPSIPEGDVGHFSTLEGATGLVDALQEVLW